MSDPALALQELLRVLRRAAGPLTDDRLDARDVVALFDIVKVGIKFCDKLPKLTGIEKKLLLTQAVKELCPDDTVDAILAALIDEFVVVRKGRQSLALRACCSACRV